MKSSTIHIFCQQENSNPEHSQFSQDGKKMCQFEFLTPLGTDNIDTNDDVKIIKLSKIQN